MHGTFYLSGTLHHAVEKSKSTIRKVMMLENMLVTFVLARNSVLTNAIVSQDNTTR